MRKGLLFATALCLAGNAMAQTTIDSALDAVSGDNSYTLGSDVESASVYWKFTADKDYYATVDKIGDGSVPAVSYDKDGSQVTIKGVTLTYPQTVYAFKKGVTYYFTMSNARGEVAFNLKLQEAANVGAGVTQDNPIKIELGKEQFFGDPFKSTNDYNPHVIYATYTAEKDGQLRLKTKTYVNNATVNGIACTTEADYQNNINYIKTAVKAGETYNFVFSNYNAFLATSEIVDVVEGSLDMPYTLNVEGENKVPAKMGDYFFTFTPNKEGFLNISSDALIPGGKVEIYESKGQYTSGQSPKATSESGSYNVRMEVKSNYGSFNTYFIVVKKLEDSQEDTFKAEMQDYQPGETEATAFDLSSMPSDAQTLPQASGTYYYKFVVPAGTEKFIVVKANKSEATTMSLYSFGNSYDATVMENGTIKRYVGGNGYESTYILKVAASEANPLSFTVAYADVAEGSLATLPKQAKLGDNDIDVDGTEYFEYTATQDGKLSVEVDPDVTVSFLKGPGQYDGSYDAVQKGSEFYLAATKDTKYLIKVSGAVAGSLMTVSEKAFEAGESKQSPIEMTSMEYTLPKVASNLWLLYTVTEDGILDFACDAPYLESGADRIEITQNDGYPMSMMGTETSGSESNTVYKGKMTVAKGDKLYIHVMLSGDMTGKKITFTAHEAAQGETYTNPLVLTKEQSVTIQGAARTTPIWVKVSLPAGETKFRLSGYANNYMYTSEENIQADHYENIDWNRIYSPDYTSSYNECTVTMAEAGDVFFKFDYQNEPVEFSISEQIPTGINNFEVETDAKVEVFTLDGKKIAQPSGNGVYIIKQGGKTKKVVVRK